MSSTLTLNFPRSFHHTGLLLPDDGTHARASCVGAVAEGVAVRRISDLGMEMTGDHEARNEDERQRVTMLEWDSAATTTGAR